MIKGKGFCHDGCDDNAMHRYNEKQLLALFTQKENKTTREFTPSCNSGRRGKCKKSHKLKKSHNCRQNKRFDFILQ